MAPAIANAIEDAVGVRIRDLPITAEKVYAALQSGRKARKGVKGQRWTLMVRFRRRDAAPFTT